MDTVLLGRSDQVTDQSDRSIAGCDVYHILHSASSRFLTRASISSPVSAHSKGTHCLGRTDPRHLVAGTTTFVLAAPLDRAERARSLLLCEPPPRESAPQKVLLPCVREARGFSLR